MYDYLISNGVLVFPSETFIADIAVNNGKIVAIGNLDELVPAKEKFDASGKFIIPGLIDPHVHMKHPYKGIYASDNFFTTSVSAAYGGTTTIIDFAIQWDKSKKLSNIIHNRRIEIENDSVVDFGLHGTPTRSDEETINSVKKSLELGVTSFKVYMVYRDQGRIVEDPVIFKLLKELKSYDALLMVHAENCSMADYYRDHFLSLNKKGVHNFPDTKPDFVEAEAINRIIFLNRLASSRLYIVHLSTQMGLEIINSAQNLNEEIYAETCPHYLLLNREVYEQDNGKNFLCSPPLRTNDDCKALWKGLADGKISVISSDHCGFNLMQKNMGNDDFSMTPNGLPGAETRLPLIYTEGVLQHRISLQQMVSVLSVNAAKIFNLYPQKGCLLPGSDADFCVFDINDEWIIKAKDLHGAVDWSPYEGMRVKGRVIATMLRGTFIVKNGSLMVDNGFGKFIYRTTKN